MQRLITLTEQRAVPRDSVEALGSRDSGRTQKRDSSLTVSAARPVLAELP